MRICIAGAPIHRCDFPVILPKRHGTVALSNNQTKHTAAARLNTSLPPLLNAVLPTRSSQQVPPFADVIVGSSRGGTWEP